MADPQSISESIEESAKQGVRRAMVDGQSTELHSLPDQIEAHRFSAEQKAAKKRKLGIRFGRFIPGGAGV